MKRFFASVGVAVVAAVGASTAVASKPTREFGGEFTDQSFSGICAFTVDRHVLVNRSYVTTFSDGRVLITGTFKERLTNTSNGNFVDFNGSGPIIIRTNDDGTSTETDLGPQFERPPGQLLLTTGPVVTTFDSDGNPISFEQLGGTSTDVCQLLA